MRLPECWRWQHRGGRDAPTQQPGFGPSIPAWARPAVSVCECVCCCVTSLHSINKRWSIRGFFSGPSRTSWVTTWLDRASQPLMSCFPLKDQPHVFKGFSCKEHVSLSWSEFQNRLKTLETLRANFQQTQTFYFFLLTHFLITHHVTFYKDIVLFTHVSLFSLLLLVIWTQNCVFLMLLLLKKAFEFDFHTLNKDQRLCVWKNNNVSLDHIKKFVTVYLKTCTFKNTFKIA